MVDCNQRQREIYKGTERHRCIHPEASTKNEIVPLEVCEACPLAKLVKAKPCAEKHKQELKIKFTSNNVPQESRPLPVLEDPEYPQCPYRYKGVDGHMCSITNLGVTAAICQKCDAETRVEERNNQASLGTKALNYFGAIRRWIASGRPTRSEEEIAELFETHCKQCDMFDKEKYACKSCGCSVSTSSEPLGNKLKMKTEACPLGRW